MAKVRMNVEVSQEIADWLDELARDEDTTKTELVRRALSVLKAYKKQKTLGRTHMGFTSDPSTLQAELVGILDN
ncbi:ribbon-helix-helix protein, CopG family [Mesorhizobium sp. M0029]|uniref:ribbon-helix-helix protein, CopG family n=1 Tax=Mesorhizobium sp. M0029 TaxID=2956850 RepID=UPI003339BE1B